MVDEMEGGSTMAKPGVERRLAAILAADVVGYSRLMGADEEGTLQTLKASRRVFFDHIQTFRGNIVNAPGDAILAEFGSVVDAVTCATEIQREIAERNQELAEEKQMLFRIGINLGDVMVDGDAIYGDGVNVAARLESLADPGGICISGSVHEQVQQRLSLHYQSAGTHKVKNISKPVATYKVLTQPGDAAHRVMGLRSAITTTQRKFFLVAAVLVAIMAGGGYMAWQAAGPASNDQAQQGELNPGGIAVLPFDNLSNDPEQEYFSDGISENLLTALSRFSRLNVIARNSSFFYKGKSKDIRQIGQELGVRFVLEGSVQQAGTTVRVTAQLIDAKDGSHIWAEQYDRKLTELFIVQDEITAAIVGVLGSILAESVPEAASQQIEGKPIKNWEAVDYTMKAWHTNLKGFKAVTDAGLHREAIRLAEKAISLDPELSFSYVILAWAHGALAGLGGGRKSFMTAMQNAQKAVVLDPNDDGTHSVAGFMLHGAGKLEESLASYQRALALNPNNADTLARIAFLLVSAGQPKEALKLAEKAQRLNPRWPLWYPRFLGTVYYFNGMYQETLAAVARETRTQATPTVRLAIASHVKLGNMDKAKEGVRKLLEIEPDFSISTWGKTAILPKEAKEDYMATLRRAGAPD